MAVSQGLLADEWNYEFHCWEPYFGSSAMELVKSEDRSESYEMNRAHVFKLKNRKYAFVGESGCSCYVPSNATIEIFTNKQAALAAFNKWWLR